MQPELRDNLPRDHTTSYIKLNFIFFQTRQYATTKKIQKFHIWEWKLILQC